MIELTKEEKTAIIEQHIKGLNYSLYNAQIDLVEAQAVTNPEQETVDRLTDVVNTINLKITALKSELDKLG